ncbi:hypothetical protein HK097_003108 [Rhizophlyctis rosea]|uniref:Uncharacterized protein n=1 Tax=Rhizophlyctis rosea TaxID=64517 RepID=A0AAD5S404_9FUNG|nr:hypothetical protein HK097_003108 [Rhizophlyctis rosea]
MVLRLLVAIVRFAYGVAGLDDPFPAAITTTTTTLPPADGGTSTTTNEDTTEYESPTPAESPPTPTTASSDTEPFTPVNRRKRRHRARTTPRAIPAPLSTTNRFHVLAPNVYVADTVVPQAPRNLPAEAYFSSNRFMPLESHNNRIRAVAYLSKPTNAVESDDGFAAVAVSASETAVKQTRRKAKNIKARTSRKREDQIVLAGLVAAPLPSTAPTETVAAAAENASNVLVGPTRKSALRSASTPAKNIRARFSADTYDPVPTALTITVPGTNIPAHIFEEHRHLSVAYKVLLRGLSWYELTVLEEEQRRGAEEHAMHVELERREEVFAEGYFDVVGNSSWADLEGEASADFFALLAEKL